MTIKALTAKETIRFRPELSWFLSIVTLMLFVNTSQACDCAYAGPPCQAFWKTDAVFSATMSSTSLTFVDDDDDARHRLQHLSVHFTVEDVFKGELVGPDVEVITGMGEGDCGYHFEKGKKYLIYASRYGKDNRLYAGICSRTRLLSEANEDLAYFRNLPRENSGANILVTVVGRSLPLKDDSRYEITPMQGVKITADHVDKHFEGKTDEKGQYEFIGLPPGTYRVRSELSANPRNQSESELTIVDRGCGSVEFSNNVDGNISGRVIDGAGNPVNGVKVDLINLEEAVVESPRGKWQFTNAEGFYSLTDVPPGKYMLGVNLIGAQSTRCPRPRTYYLDPNNLSQAGYVEKKEGEELRGHDIQLIPALPEQELEGIVVWPDGKPAVRAVVALANGTGSHYLIGGQKVVDGRGRFILKGVEGCRYQILAFTYGGRVSANSDEIEDQRHAEPVIITFTKGQLPLVKLILTSPGFQHRDDEPRLSPK